MNLILKLFSFKTISDACFSWLFRITVPGAYFGCLFQMTFPDDCRMPPNDYFRLLFQMNISDVCFKWLFRMTVCNATTDSCFSCQSVFPRLIPISTYHSTDWSHDWFVFERQLPTAELWPRSPLILNYSEFVWVVLIDIFHECFELNWHGEEFFFFFRPLCVRWNICWNKVSHFLVKSSQADLTFTKLLKMFPSFWAGRLYIY